MTTIRETGSAVGMGGAPWSFFDDVDRDRNYDLDLDRDLDPDLDLDRDPDLDLDPQPTSRSSCQAGLALRPQRRGIECET